MSSRLSGNVEVASNLSNVVGAIGFFGIVGFLAMLYLLLSNGFNWAGVAWISIFYLAAISLICSKILRLIAVQTGRAVSYRTRPLAPAELKAASTGQLFEGRTSPASVVDQTTRTLDKAPIARN